MKVFTILGLLCLSLSFAHAAKIRRCNKNETTEIKRARKFLRDNINTIFADSRINDLTKREKRVIRRKLGLRPLIKGVVIKCMDDRKVCNNRRLLGMERSLFNKRVLVCYQNIKRLYRGSAFCNLADTLLHEIGHASRVKKAKNHNDGPNGDRVYRLGDAAERLCNRRSLNRSIL